MGADLAQFIRRWSTSSASEQQNKDQFRLDLCDALGVERPEPASGDPSRAFLERRVRPTIDEPRWKAV